MFLKRLLLIVIAIVMTFAATACSRNVSKGNLDQNSEEELVLTIETVDISDIENGKTYQDIKYPVVEYKNNTAMQKSMNELNIKAKKSAEEFKKENKRNVRDFIKEFNNEDAMYTYDSSMTCTFHNDNYLSMLNNIYMFTMGAHGSEIDNGYTYYISTGKKLTLKDFIRDEEELKKFLKDWVKKQEEGMLFPDAESNIDMYFNGESELQFYLIDNELRVIFQQYDIAPYAVGIIEVTIDKSLLKVELN